MKKELRSRNSISIVIGEERGGGSQFNGIGAETLSTVKGVKAHANVHKMQLKRAREVNINSIVYSNNSTIKQEITFYMNTI